MSAKYRVEVTFDLGTTVEFDGTVYFDESLVEDLDDSSYFASEDVSTSGGSVSFVVEADSEEEAQDKAEEVVSDGSEHDDYSGRTWVVENVSYDVEEIEEEMTLDRAIALLRSLVDESGDEKQSEALDFLLDRLNSLTRDVSDLQRRVETLERLAAASTTPTVEA